MQYRRLLSCNRNHNEYGVLDDGDGLYYVWARYYDAVTSRFISRDPIMIKGVKTVNPYQYAINNPLTLC